MSLTGFYDWLQAEATIAILICAIIYTLIVGAWKRAFIAWAVGMLGFALALFVVAGPEMLIGLGRWLADLINLGG